MSRGGAINLTDLSGGQVAEWLQSFDTILCDGDGEFEGRRRCHKERYGAFARVVTFSEN